MRELAKGIGAGVALLGLALSGACDDRPDAAMPASERQATCAVPSEGCACAPGATTACAYTVKGDNDFLWCAEGVRTCVGGAWGVCVSDGQVSVRSRSSTSLSSAGLLHTTGLGAPAACVSGDAGLDPCDPYCNVTSDTPDGFDAGPAFGLRDGGLVVLGCGDAVIGGGEECDDGNTVSGDGCSSQCLLEAGFQCPTPGAPCTATVCGNGVREGAEGCDDGNLRPYDGCSPTCQKEPACPTGECFATCGDGLKFETEACDDGNLNDGDGCSSTCTVEAGSTCTVAASALPAKIDVPIIYRDFTPSTSPDFENYCCGLATGIAKSTLAADGKPELNATKGLVNGAASFANWYRDSSSSRVVYDTLPLTKQPDDSYVYYSSDFFPLNGKGFGNYGTTGKNFHFTSELRYPFTYSGGEVLNFKGDDDVFVFINGKLAVDLGGVHSEESGSITLTPAKAATLGLVTGHTYEIAVFQAERHTVASNYKLTLRGFVHARSICAAPTSLTFTRDFEAVCAPGERMKWQLFRWRAAVPAGTSIDFRAGTADTKDLLPTAAGDSSTVPIGSATPANSPDTGPVAWVNDVDPGPPVTPYPVSRHLADSGQTSKQWLRVFVSFNPIPASSPRLDEWQQLYDCVPSE